MALVELMDRPEPAAETVRRGQTRVRQEGKGWQAPRTGRRKAGAKKGAKTEEAREEAKAAQRAENRRDRQRRPGLPRPFRGSRIAIGGASGSVGASSLLDPNIGVPDDLAPFRGLDLDHRREFRGRIADRFGAKAGELFLYIGLRPARRAISGEAWRRCRSACRPARLMLYQDT